MDHILNQFSSKLKYKHVLEFGEIFRYLKSYQFISAVDAVADFQFTMTKD